MSILFYDHLIDKTPIETKLKQLDLPEEKRLTFSQKIDNIIHTGLLEYILQKLHPHHHHTFLTQVEHAPYDPQIITFLRVKVDADIESQLEKEAHRLIKLVLKDLDS